jgi:hypothetical protein
MVMGKRFHRGFTAAEKTELWDRCLFFGGSAWRDSCCGAAPLKAGIDTVGARGDFQRYYGTSIGTIDGKVAWPLTLDGKPGNEPQWRL